MPIIGSPPIRSRTPIVPLPPIQTTHEQTTTTTQQAPTTLSQQPHDDNASLFLGQTVSIIGSDSIEQEDVSVGRSLFDLLSDNRPVVSESAPLRDFLNSVQPRAGSIGTHVEEPRTQLSAIRKSLEFIGISGVAEIAEILDSSITVASKSKKYDQQMQQLKQLAVDGLRRGLETHYLEREISLRKDQYSRTGNVCIKVITWNVDGKGSPSATLHSALIDDSLRPDIYVIGFLGRMWFG